MGFATGMKLGGHKRSISECPIYSVRAKEHHLERGRVTNFLVNGGGGSSGRAGKLETTYECGYCGGHKMSTSVGCADGKVRINCPCGGRAQTGVLKQHTNWFRVPNQSDDLLQSKINEMITPNGVSPVPEVRPGVVAGSAAVKSTIAEEPALKKDFTGPYSPGDFVQLHSFKTNNFKNLNFKTGIVENFVEEVERYMIRLLNGNRVAVTSSNLYLYNKPMRTLENGDTVVIDGIQSKPELNGTIAKLQEYEPEKPGRFIVQLDDGSELSL